MSELTNAAETNGLNAKVKISTGESIEITVDEFARLKDIETRFKILKQEMLKASYCPIHHQIILGIENECKQQEIKTNLLPDARDARDAWDPLKPSKQRKEIEVPSFMQEDKQ